MDKNTQGLLLILLVIGVVVYLSRKGLLGGGMSNKEEWQIERDKEGRLTQIIVHRKVKNE